MQFPRAGTGEFHTGIKIALMSVIAAAELIADVEAAVKDGSPERRVRMLRRVTDLLLSDATRLNQHHIRVFDDVLVRLIERVDAQALAQLSATLAELASAPQETVRRLARHDDATVAGPLLQKSRSLADADLHEIANNCSQRHLLALSGRRPIGETLTEVILKRAGPGVRETIQAEIDSIAVREIRKMAWPIDYSEALTMVDALNRIGKLNDSTVNRFAVRGEYTNLAAALSVLSGANIESIEPLLDDIGCEGLVIACRASRLNWQTTLAVINHRSVPRLSKQELEQARELFETLYVSTAQYTIRFEPPGRSAPRRQVADGAFATAGGGQ